MFVFITLLFVGEWRSYIKDFEISLLSHLHLVFSQPLLVELAYHTSSQQSLGTVLRHANCHSD
jgi:hypothetical protein